MTPPEVWGWKDPDAWKYPDLTIPMMYREMRAAQEWQLQPSAWDAATANEKAKMIATIEVKNTVKSYVEHYYRKKSESAQ